MVGREREVVVAGIVSGADWDDEGPNRVVLLTDDESEVALADEGLGWDLLDYLRERVEVRGMLRQGEDARPEILVESYRLLEWEGD